MQQRRTSGPGTPVAPQKVFEDASTQTPRSPLPEHPPSPSESSPKARSNRPVFVQWRVAKGWSGNFDGSASTGRRNAAASNEEPNRKVSMSTTLVHRRNERLADELHSLREAYSRKIAATELRCERLMAEKDEEVSSWYKEKKHEIRKMQAAFVIMKALYDKSRRRIQDDFTVKAEGFAVKEGRFQHDLTLTEEKYKYELTTLKKDFSQRSAELEATIVDFKTRTASLNSARADLEARLAKEQHEVSRLIGDLDAKNKIIKDLHRQLSESSLEDQVAAKARQIEHLEAEVKRTRRIMQKQNQMENEGLRKEVMDYIKFIVHKLPADWEERGEYADTGQYEVPSYLREKFNAALEERAKRRSPSPRIHATTIAAYEGSARPSSKGHPVNPSPGGGTAILPQLSLATTSRGWQTQCQLVAQSTPHSEPRVVRQLFPS